MESKGFFTEYFQITAVEFSICENIWNVLESAVIMITLKINLKIKNIVNTYYYIAMATNMIWIS